MRARFVISLMMFPCVVSLFAQNAQLVPAPPGMNQRPMGNATVTGHIFCADTNAPARFARINLQRLPDMNGGNGARGMIMGGGSQATSDLEGAYTIPNVAPGTYTFRINYDGYVDPFSTADFSKWTSPDPAVQSLIRQQFQTVTINGSETATIDLRLDHGSSIGGRIIFDDGSPAVGLTVQVRAAAATSGRYGQRFMSFQGPNRTDDHGNFRVIGLPEGEFQVLTNIVIPHIMPPSSNPSILRSYGNTHQVYSPGVFREKEAEVIKLGRGEDRTGLQITIPTRGFHAISGTVIRKSTGAPVFGGNIQLLAAEDGVQVSNTQIGGDGIFRLDLVPKGSYIVRVGTAFEQPANNTPGPQNRSGFRFLGTDQIAVQVSESDVTGVTLQVPESADPTRPPQQAAPVPPLVR